MDFIAVLPTGRKFPLWAFFCPWISEKNSFFMMSFFSLKSCICWGSILLPIERGFLQVWLCFLLNLRMLANLILDGDCMCSRAVKCLMVCCADFVIFTMLTLVYAQGMFSVKPSLLLTCILLSYLETLSLNESIILHFDVVFAKMIAFFRFLRWNFNYKHSPINTSIVFFW